MRRFQAGCGSARQEPASRDEVRCDRVSCVAHKSPLASSAHRLQGRVPTLDQTFKHGPQVQIGNFCGSTNGQRKQHRFSDVLRLQHSIRIISLAGDFVKVDLPLSCRRAWKDRRHPNSGLIDLIPQSVRDRMHRLLGGCVRAAAAGIICAGYQRVHKNNLSAMLPARTATKVASKRKAHEHSPHIARQNQPPGRVSVLPKFIIPDEWTKISIRLKLACMLVASLLSCVSSVISQG